jgi:outer membrane protein assembly factor BamB
MRCVSLVGLTLALATAAYAAPPEPDNWPSFRGPSGQGLTQDKNLPLTWGGPDNKNVLWKSPLKGEGHASPIVWGDKVFVASVAPPIKADVIPEHHLTCYAASDGKLLWDTVIPPGPWKRSDFRSGPGGGYACPTPATDGKRVYCVFASAVIAAVNVDGTLAWRKEIVPYTFDVTIGASPVCFENNVLMLCTMAKKTDSKILAYAADTGEIAWQSKLPDTGFGHSTPLLISLNNQPQLLISAGTNAGGSDNALQSVNPRTGERIWFCKGTGESSTPIFADNLVYFDSGRGGAGTLVEPTGTGDLSKNIKAEIQVGGEALSSPLLLDKRLYRLVGNTFKCWDTATGKLLYAEKLDKPSSPWASPIADANGRIYLATAGRSFVLQSGPTFKLLATNDLSDGSHPSPAASNNKLFLAGAKNLWCIGEK